MTGDPKECREHARQCLEQARSAPTLLVMTRFESLAHSWIRLAEDLERAEALLIFDGAVETRYKEECFPAADNGRRRLGNVEVM